MSAADTVRLLHFSSLGCTAGFLFFIYPQMTENRNPDENEGGIGGEG